MGGNNDNNIRTQSNKAKSIIFTTKIRIKSGPEGNKKKKKTKDCKDQTVLSVKPYLTAAQNNTPAKPFCRTHRTILFHLAHSQLSFQSESAKDK